MHPNKTLAAFWRFFVLCFFLYFLSNKAQAVTLTSDQTDYSTTEDITTSDSGIISSLSGSSDSLNTIENSYTITTGDSGSTSSAYGIKVTGDYNQVTNSSGGEIVTTGSSGRGISISDYSEVINAGSITTEGTTSYGIYAGGDENTLTNSGSITTSNTSAYGVYINGDNNSLTNSGTIDTQVYGIYSNGDANSVLNSGTISTTSGSSAYGIYISAGSSSTASETNYTTVENSGTITSETAHGIYARDDYIEITNSGTITSGDGSSDYGIRSSGDYATINNSGTINSTTYAIYNDGSGSTINNSGDLSGGIYIGDGTLNILGGTISGTVEGDDVGSVVVSADFTQSSTFENITTLTIDSNSTLTSNSSIDATTISIDEDSSLTISSGSSISAAIQAVSDGVGILNIDTDFTSSDAIGTSSYSLAEINILSGASLTASDDIYASDISITGELDLSGTDGLTIFGNVSGSGSGTLNLGSNSQTISGDLTLTSGDTLATTLDGTTIGNVTITGTATISSDTSLSITTSLSDTYIEDGTEFTIIDADSSSSIEAISDSNISIDDSGSNVSNFLRFTTEATSSSLVLVVNRLSASEVTSNVNMQNIYQNLNDIGSSGSGTLLEFQNYLDNNSFSESELDETLNQLAPQSSKANLAITANVANNNISIFEKRLGTNRQNLETGLWLEPIVSTSSQDAIKYDEGYSANSVGLMVGADKKLSENHSFGMSLSYVRSNTKTIDDSKEALISSNQLSIFSSNNWEKYFFDIFGGFAWNSFSSSRAINAVESNAKARFSGQTYIAKVKTGFRENLQYGFSVTPELSLNFLRNNIAKYTEKGADELNLTVSSVAANSLEGRIGINLGYETKVYNLIQDIPEIDRISANLNLSYGHFFVNDTPTTTASFSGQELSFDSEISNIDNQSLKTAMSINLHSQTNTTISANYEFEKKQTWQSHLLGFKIKQMF